MAVTSVSTHCHKTFKQKLILSLCHIAISTQMTKQIYIYNERGNVFINLLLKAVWLKMHIYKQHEEKNFFGMELLVFRYI